MLSKAARIDLADSALHAPSASFGGEEFIDKAAVLTCRLVWNHPLPDGNKRAAWAALVLFLDLNRIVWSPDHPVVDEAEQAMLAVAAHDVEGHGSPTGSVSAWSCPEAITDGIPHGGP